MTYRATVSLLGLTNRIVEAEVLHFSDRRILATIVYFHALLIALTPTYATL